MRHATGVRIAEALARNRARLQQNPSAGVGTARTRVTVGDGLHCVIEDGPWTLAAALTARQGGGGAPDPGVLGRGALGSCLALTYALWAAPLGITFSGLQVEVEADYDSRGMLGVGDVSPAYGGIRVHVTVETDEDESRVAQWLEEAERHTVYLATFRDPQSVQRHLHLVRPRAGEALTSQPAGREDAPREHTLERFR